MSMFGPRGQVPRARPDYAGLTTDPHRSTFQQPRLYSTKRQKPEKPLWLDTCYYRSNLISMCRNHNMRAALRSLTRGCEIAHMIHGHCINQWGEEVTQPCDYRLFGAGWSMQSRQLCQIGPQSIEHVRVLLRAAAAAAER